MESFIWSSKFSVGNTELDKQHQMWLSYIDELHKVMLAGKGREEVLKVVAEMMEYTVVHLNYEEELLTRFHYPDLLAHKAQHELLRDKIEEFHLKLSTGHLMVKIEVMNMLRSWLVHHINNTDKLYTKFLMENGVI